MQATVLSTQEIRVSSSVGGCVRFHYYAQRKILIVTSMAVPFSLQALQHKLFYCHRLQSPVSQAKETQSLNMLLWVEYLSRKVKLFLTGWWSNMFCEAGICTQITANFVAKLICALWERINQFEATNGSAPISSFQQLSTPIFLIMPTCAMKLFTTCAMKLFTELKVDFGLTTKFVPTGLFWANKLFGILVGSVMGRLISGADDIPWIAHVFSTAQKDCFGTFLKVSMGVNGHGQFHIILMLLTSLFTLLLLILSPLVVQASGNFVLVFCHTSLSCLVCPPSGYLQLELYGRKQVVQLLYTVMHTLAVSKSMACASKVLWWTMKWTSKVLVRFNFQILEQL
ncbi:uncharacterized protein LOC113334901 [Papaver somniferum]|uniref:uncharacterized protein LOC113334901 n=1 Tax=Papaver somniferum TaxID=3469 RepID=UPI000E705037|nr:uncharacterized protein LOC113334901 [Papaver somniferum]